LSDPYFLPTPSTPFIGCPLVAGPTRCVPLALRPPVAEVCPCRKKRPRCVEARRVPGNEKMPCVNFRAHSPASVEPWPSALTPRVACHATNVTSGATAPRGATAVSLLKLAVRPWHWRSRRSIHRRLIDDRLEAMLERDATITVAERICRTA